MTHDDICRVSFSASRDDFFISDGSDRVVGEVDVGFV